MKKVFTILLACCLIICTMTACGNYAVSNPEEETDSEAQVTPEGTEADAETENPEEIAEWEYEPKYTFEKIPWVEAYREYLLECIDSGGLQGDATFGLFQIDDDDIPELVFTSGHSHPCGCLIVSYINGELKVSEPVGEYGYFEFAEKQGLVVSQRSASGVYARQVTVYQLKDGVLTNPWKCELYEQSMFEGETFIGSEMKYWINEEEVSEAAYLEAVAQHIPEDLKTTGDLFDYLFDWMPLPLNAKTVNYYFDAYSADKDAIAHAEDEDFSISGYLEEKQCYASFGDWGENHYVYMLRLPEPLPVYFEDEFYFLEEIQVEQYYKTHDLLNTYCTLSGEISPARTPYHHSPFIIMPNLH